MLIKSPASQSETTVAGSRVTVNAVAQSESSPITSVKILVDGVIVREKTFPNAALSQSINEDVPLRPGKTNLVQVAFSNGKEESDFFKVRAGGPDLQKKPDLYVLAVGISKYKDTNLQLEYADKDAEAVVKLFTSQKGGMFNDVKVRMIVNEEATREAILEGLGWLREEATPYDLRVVFLSGHGGISNDRYFLWCYPFDQTSRIPQKLNLPGDEIMNMVLEMRGRVVVLVDTCHSSAIVGTGRGSRPDPDIVAVFKRQEVVGTVVFTFASSGRAEKSIEHREWGHGAFTKALLDAFEGKAPDLKQAVRTLELGRWLEKQVPELTRNTQNARTISIPVGADGFELFQLK